MNGIGRAGAAGLLALLVLAGCVGWSAEGRRGYLEAIPVTTPNLASIADGVSTGSYPLTLPPGGSAAYPRFTVDVTMASGAIAAIAIKVPKELSTGSFPDTIVTGPKGVIVNQSLDVDAVSGASYSSKAFLKAVETALTR